MHINLPITQAKQGFLRRFVQLSSDAVAKQTTLPLLAWLFVQSISFFYYLFECTENYI